MRMRTIKQEVDQETGDMITLSDEVRIVSEEQIENIIDSIPFFRRLGGTEVLHGNRLVSVSPDRKNCTIREWGVE